MGSDSTVGFVMLMCSSLSPGFWIAKQPGSAGRIPWDGMEKKHIFPSDFKITHLAKGIPVGGELEYTDQETLESALEGRK